MKIRIIFLSCIVLVLIANKQAEMMLNRVSVGIASSHKVETSLETKSGPFSQPVFTQQKSPSSLSSPQVEWQRLDYPVLPSPRVGSSLILNPVNKVALLFGGINSTTGELNDLWLTDGHNWLQFQTPHLPKSRSDASMAYDELHQTAVLFGGIRGGELLGDTWLFNGVDWIQQNPVDSPDPRTGASMVYDAERNVTILFGGMADVGGNNNEALNEMWIWDGETWQQQFPATLPPARWGAKMVYHRARRSIILFGGGSGGGFLEDTWLWDGVTWIELYPSHHPAGRANFGIAYDENRQHVILFAGQTYLDVDPPETWAWDGQDWTQLPTRQAPPKELAYGAQLVYLPDLQTVILYNALRQKTIVSDQNLTYTDRSEVWILAYQNLIYLPIVSMH